MKKTLAILLALVMVLAMVPAMAEGAATDTWDPLSGKYEISTAADFQAFISGFATIKDGSYSYKDKIITLKRNIDLSGADLSSIQVVGIFAGTFDGDNYTISNFIIKQPLFGNMGKLGIVKDLTIESVTLNNSIENERIGIVCSRVNGKMNNVTVKDCTINSTVAIGVAGGLAAMTQGGCVVDSCSVTNLTVNASGGAVAIGGAFGIVIGDAVNEVYAYVSNVSVPGTKINTTADTYGSTGGFYGVEQAATAYAIISGISVDTPDVTYTDADVIADGVPYKADTEGKIETSELDFGTKEVGYSAITAKEVVITNNTGNAYTLSYNELSDYDVNVTIVRKETVATLAVEEIAGDDKTLGIGDKAIISINPKTGLSAGEHNDNLVISRTNTDSSVTPNPATLTVKLKFKVSAPTSTGTGISLWYEGGNSFGSSKSAVPTSVEINGKAVSFTGTGSQFTVSCVPADAKWVTVRWNSTTVTTNFTPDARAACAAVAIPKTGDMPLWKAIAEFFGF